MVSVQVTLRIVQRPVPLAMTCIAQVAEIVAIPESGPLGELHTAQHLVYLAIAE
jgi:hypothetical protein